MKGESRGKILRDHLVSASQPGFLAQMALEVENASEGGGKEEKEREKGVERMRKMGGGGGHGGNRE